MNDPIVVLLAVIAVLLFAILLAICPPCLRVFKQAIGLLLVVAFFLVPVIFLVLVGAVVWLGVWLVRAYDLYDVLSDALLAVIGIGIVFALIFAVFGLFVWIDGYFMDKRFAERWKKWRADERADDEKDKPAE